MLLDLPRALLEDVYDMLHVHDRIRLNAALPRNGRVERTTRTSRQKDDKLALVCLAMKRKPATVRPAAATLRFLSENRNEPTVRALVDEHGVALPVLDESGLLDRVRSKCQLPMLASDVSSDPSVHEEIARLLVEHGTPQQLEALAVPLGHAIIDIGSTILFVALNYRNEAMVKHLVERGAELYGIDVAAALEVVTEGSGSFLLRTPRCRESMLRLLPLSAAHREIVLESALDDLDVEAWRRMSAACAPLHV